MLPLTSEVGRVESVAYSLDGTRLAVAGNNGVEVWSVPDYECLWQWMGEGFQSADFTSSSAKLISFDSVRRLRSLCTTTGGDHDLPFGDRTMRLSLFAAGFQRQGVTVGNPGHLYHLQWTNLVVSGRAMFDVRWRHTYEGVAFGSITHAANPDRLLALARITTPEQGESQNQLLVLNPDTGEILRRSKSGYSRVDHFTGSPDGRFVVGVLANTLLVWNGAYLHRPALRYNNDTTRQFTGLAFHPSGRFLATASNDKTIKLWDTESWQVVRNFVWKAGRMRSVAFAPDGLTAAAGGEDGEFVVFDMDC